MIMRSLALTLVAFALLGAGCKDDAPAADAPAGKRAPPPGREPQPPPSGTDADNKRIEALDLAVKIDGELAALERGEKALELGDGKTRTVQAWMTRTTPAKPKKLVVTAPAAADTGAGGADVTDLYYDDRGYLAFARAPDGLFVFKDEVLALWLDRDQKVKRGANPSLVQARVAELMKLHKAALTTFALR